MYQPGLAVEHRQLLGQVHRHGQRRIRQAGGGRRLFQFAQRIGKQRLRFTEFLCVTLHLGKIEQVPIFQLLHDFHEPKAGQLDVQIVRFFARLQPGGFQQETPDGAHIPEQAHPRRMLIISLQRQQSVTEDHLAGHRHALGTHDHRRDGFEIHQLGAVTIDFKLDHGSAA